MDRFLLHFLALSLSCGVVGLVLVGLTQLTRAHYAARWRCVVWLMLCLRLTIPLTFLPLDATPIQIPAPSLDRPVMAVDAPPNTLDTESVQLPNSIFQPQDHSGKIPSVSQVIFGVWVSGAVAVLLWCVGSHLRLRRYLRRWARPVTEDPIYKAYRSQAVRLKQTYVPPLVYCPELKIPMLAGVLRPVLMLPEHALSDEMLDYALLHELIHFRRKDIWLKVVVVLASSIHWFNPLVWFVARHVEQDLELACDETALSMLPPEEHRAYGETILRAATQTTRIRA